MKFKSLFLFFSLCLILPQTKAVSYEDDWSPDFMIIGAQKSGTTALYKWISKNHFILPPMLKELNFFDISFKLGVDWYQDQFPERPDSNYKIGEATPLYLFHPLVPERVHLYYPDIKLIVLLRNPIDRAYSHYYHTRRLNVEPLSFEEAIEKEAERLGNIDERIYDTMYVAYPYRNFSYVSRGIYVEQLERWLSYFPREQILILKYEDLMKDPDGITNTTYRFLDIPEKHLPNSEYYLYTTDHEKAPMNPETRQKLQEYYAPYNQQLEDLLDMKFDWN